MYLYALCAKTAGHYFEGTVSAEQAKEIAATLMLCPDHPKRAALEASAGEGISLEAAQANGKLVYSGKYLVGKTAQPGTWQSQGESVESCYWAGFTVEGCGFRWISR